MAMRLSGLMSGMDTESIIQQLVEAKSTKLNKAKKAQIKVNWQQDAWKELNTKLKNLQAKYIGNMRFYSSYSKKTTKVSNPNAVSVITGESAVNGVQSLQIKQLAKTGYLTGAELKNASGSKGDYTALTKLSELGVDGEGTFNVKTGNGSVDIRVNGDTTISDVLTQLKDAGLNASFDTKTQRFFVSAKESGADNDFSLTALDGTGAAALSALGLQVNLDDDAASRAEYNTFASYYVKGDRAATLEKMRSLIDSDVQSRVDGYLSKYKSIQDSLTTARNKINEINKKYADEGKTLKSVEEYQSELDTKNERIKTLEESLKAEDSPLTDEDRELAEKELAGLKEEVSALNSEKADAETLAKQNETVANLEKQAADIEQYVNITTAEDGEGNTTYSAAATGKLTQEVEDRFYNKAEYASQVVDGTISLSGGATKVNGQDAIISLNGAEFTNSTNVFEINGLTFTALSETAPGETITVTTQNDTDGIYDMIKNFLKEYNSVINEMDKLYNASSSKGYEPLLSEEKEAMSDTEVEEYEKKIKESLLRNDSNLSSVSSALKEVMAAGVTVNGKQMYLTDFGINTLGYFAAADNEKNAYYIDGDPDSENTSGNPDKLKGLISSDPDTVISFFTGLAQNLYGKMSDLSKSVEGYRSFGSFFDDKKMKSDYDSYTSKIADLQEKLNDYEDKWYKKFSKMETALAKLQSKTNAFSGLLGG